MPISILISSIILLVGALITFKALKDRFLSKKAREWPVVKGTVLSSEVKEDEVRTPTGKATYAYYPEVAFEYKVSGKSYQGNRITVGNPRFVYLDAVDIRDRFPAESVVDVYYNPGDPSYGLLAPKSFAGMRSLIPGIFLIVAGIIVTIITLLSQ